MSHSVSQHLRIDVAEYDALIRRFIPHYAEMVERATTAVAAAEPALILDLGAGTGALSESLLRKTTTAVVELWDVDDTMLAVARERLARFGDRVRFVHRSFGDPFPPADAMMASLALHHIRSVDDKGRLYRRAAEALRPGGVLVNGDAVVPVEAPGHAALYRTWADHMVANGIEERQAWAHFADWSGEDRYLALDQELALLAAAGLDASCPWQDPPVAVMAGRKPR